MDNISKLCLGTAQFGMNYGVNNTTGQPNQEEINTMLNMAYKNRVLFLDTASAYGMSELSIGSFIENNKNSGFNIITKLSPGITDEKIITQKVEQSIENLKINSMYGYLIHSYSDFINDNSIFNKLINLKSTYNIGKIGVSLYLPSELINLLENNISIEIVQIPYSILDTRFEKLFPELKKRNIEIHVRSVFLQGLLFKKPESLKGKLISFHNHLKKINEICMKNKIDVDQLALGWVLKNKQIDKIVVGIDNIQNLSRLIDIETGTYFYDYYGIQELQNIKINERLLNPGQWR